MAEAEDGYLCGLSAALSCRFTHYYPTEKDKAMNSITCLCLLMLVAVLAGCGTKTMTPEARLYRAAGMGHLEVVKYLAEDGANVHAALHEAAFEGHLEVVKSLVEHGADVHAAASNGFTPLHAATSRGHLEVVEYLKLVGAK